MERDWKKGNLQVDKHKMFNFVTSMPRWRSLEALLQLSGLDWYQPLNLHGIIVAIVSASKKLLFQRASVDLVTSKLRAQESARVYISGDKCVAHIMQIQFFQDSSVNNFACNRGQRCWSVSCNRRLSLTLQLYFCVTFLHATLMRSSRILRQLLCKQKKEIIGGTNLMIHFENLHPLVVESLAIIFVWFIETHEIAGSFLPRLINLANEELINLKAQINDLTMINEDGSGASKKNCISDDRVCVCVSHQSR